MGKDTKIGWAHHTFNPWLGCEKVSEACTNCYAERLAKRYYPLVSLWGPGSERRITSETNWRQPIKWNAEAGRDGVRDRVFCASMADIFEDRRDLDEPRARLFDLIESTTNLSWLLLTKRPENAASLAPKSWAQGWPANAWAGATIENREQAARRIGWLLRLPAPVHFVSMEPLLEDIALDRVELREACGTCGERLIANAFSAHVSCACCEEGPEPVDWRKLDWVIVGGESGPSVRPFNVDWVRAIRDQCRRWGAAFFYKQDSGFKPNTEPLLDGVRYAEVP